MKTNVLGLMLLATGIAVVSACAKTPSSPAGDADDPARTLFASTDEATVNFYCGCSGTPEFADFVKEQVGKKYPNIRIHTMINSKEVTLESVLSSGTPPDLVFQSLGGVFKLKDLRLTSDLTPLIDKYGLDLNRFVPGTIDAMKSYSDPGTIEYLPFDMKSLVLTYNQGIFDKFAVPYPKDGMSWEQILELGKRLTREDGGQPYYGINFSIQQLLYKNQLGLTFADAKTTAPTLSTDPWKKWMDVMTGFFQIPGQGDVLTKNYILQFVKEQNLGMLISTNVLERGDFADAVQNGLKWDFASIPNFPGVDGGQLNSNLLTIPASSPNKDAAFRIVQTIVSDEAQSLRARKGVIPIVNSPEVKQAFAKDISFAAGKNLEALYKDKVAPPIASTKYDGKAKDEIMIQSFKDIATGTKDAVTSLREAQELMKKYIDSQK